MCTAMAMDFEHEKKSAERKDLICELVADDRYVPMKEKEMASFMQVSREEREEFRSILQTLVTEGRLKVTGQGKYVKPDEHRDRKSVV